MEQGKNYLNLKFFITEVSPSVQGSLQLQISLKNFQNSEPYSLLSTSLQPVSEKISFQEYLTVEYHFHLRQTISISIINSETGTLAIQSMHLRHILHPNRRIYVKDCDGSHLLVLNTTCTETSSASKLVFLILQGRSLSDLDVFSKSDPFYKLYKQEANEWKLIHQSKVVENDLNPQWEEIIMNSVIFTNGQEDNELRIDVFDYDSETSSEMIGSSTFRYSELTLGARFDLTEPKKNAFGGYVEVLKFELVDDKSFVEYLMQGISISLTVAIDFTASNGLVDRETSLHYLSKTEKNDYQKVIEIIGSVLSEYDSDKKFEVLGFGAEAPWIENKDLFALTRSMENPYVSGYDQLQEVYKDILEDKSFVLSGPTHFSPLIHHQISQCQKDSESNYHILLIITDGVMHDLQETVNALVEASNHSLSVIIVGIGYDDFSGLIKLDSDRTLLQKANGEKSKRDVVQFVPFNNYKNSFEVFSQVTMSEVPTQIMEYKKLKLMFLT